MKKTLIVTAIAALSGLPFAASASEADLLQRIDKLAAELQAMKAELAATQQKTAAVEQQQKVQAATVAAAPAAAQGEAPAASHGEAQTIVGGYGEINYNRPRKDASGAQADVRRAVIAISHRFDEQTKLVSEFEWEHAVTSASDQGESEVEQLYVEREFKNGMRAKAGLFLIPAGLLNTNHEPTAYYGVERNFVETAIIPSTWREVGLALSGTMDNGLSWDAGLTTGFDLGKWDASSTEGSESPLGSIHQEGQLAKSRNLSVHGALNWRGVPGLLLGGSVFTGKAGQGSAGFAAPNTRVSLYDLHARYTPGRWDLSALYARGHISDTDALNLTLVGEPTPVPSSFFGWYGQAAYQLYKSGDYTLSPFVRYEVFNTASGLAPAPAILGVAAGADQKVTTVGANLRIGEGVVLKADYQQFKDDSARDRMNLGVGWAF